LAMGKLKEALRDFRQVHLCSVFLFSFLLDSSVWCPVRQILIRFFQSLMSFEYIGNVFLGQVAKIVPKDPDAVKKLRECEKAVAKSKFEEAIALEWHSVAATVDYHIIGMCLI
jgi:hypothetical protein